MEPNTIDDFVAGDFNSDGNADFVLSVKGLGKSTANTILTLLGTANGEFDFVNSQNVVGDVLAAGSFNSDSELDLASGVNSASLVWTAYGQGDGHFSNQP